MAKKWEEPPVTSQLATSQLTIKSRVRFCGACLAMVFTVLGSTHVAVCANQPPVNLGFTSFLDGVSFTPSGFVYGTNTAEYAIDRVKLGESQSISIPGKGRITANVVPQIHQFIYKSPLDILGFHPGVEIILPFLLEGSEILSAGHSYRAT